MNPIESLGITKEELLAVAAQKAVEHLLDAETLEREVNNLVRISIQERVEKAANGKVEQVLTEEMEKILGQEIVPCNVWGEPKGTPTTIRDLLSERAKTFWELKVDDSGKEAGWGGTPRYELLMRKILADEFSKSIKENAEVIVAAFKKSITESSTKMVREHIDRLIK